MFYLQTCSKTILQSLAILCFATTAPAQIASLCNTGLTPATATGCPSTLVTPNPPGGGANRDGNWQLAYPYPSTLTSVDPPCTLTQFIRAWVDTPNAAWLADSANTASEWITPFNGENNQPAGAYVYRTGLHVPSVLAGGVVPTGVTINGELASDNSTVAIFLESPAHSGSCALVTGQHFPVNPLDGSDFQQWWDFSVTNALPIAPGADAFLYFLVVNQVETDRNPSPTGLRVAFFASSKFF